MNTTVSGARIPIRPDDVVLAVLPFFHVYGLTSVLNICVRHACTMVLLPRFDAAAALEGVGDEGAGCAVLGAAAGVEGLEFGPDPGRFP